jgi:large subunit ribosomal protein L18
MNNKTIARQKIRFRIRRKVSGTATKPRLSVFRSNTDIYAQLIDDNNGVTIASASSKQKDINAQKAPKIEKSKMVGQAIAKKLLNLGLLMLCSTVVDMFTMVVLKQWLMVQEKAV